jgi:hypothetical protein
MLFHRSPRGPLPTAYLKRLLNLDVRLSKYKAIFVASSASFQIPGLVSERVPMSHPSALPCTAPDIAANDTSVSTVQTLAQPKESFLFQWK